MKNTNNMTVEEMEQYIENYQNDPLFTIKEEVSEIIKKNPSMKNVSAITKKSGSTYTIQLKED